MMIGNMYRKFGEIGTCVFVICKQTDKKTRGLTQTCW